MSRNKRSQNASELFYHRLHFRFTGSSRHFLPHQHKLGEFIDSFSTHGSPISAQWLYPDGIPSRPEILTQQAPERAPLAPEIVGMSNRAVWFLRNQDQAGYPSDPKLVTDIQRRLTSLANVLSESITDLLREDLHEPADAYILTNVAERQFELTKNPLWPWMMLAVFSRGGLLPPPWVWEYLLGVALYVAEGAAEMASTSERATKRRHTVDSLVQRLCLQGKPGTPDYFTSFRQIITDLRLAMRVRRILYPENSSQKSCSLKMACNLVAQGAKKKNGRLTEAEIRAQTKLVWKAYRRFFESDGGFRMTPASRDGTLPQAHKLPDEDH